MLQVLRDRLQALLPEARVRWLPEPSVNDGHRPDAVADVKLAGRHLRLVIELLGQPNLARLSDKCAEVNAYALRVKGGVPVLVAPYLNEEMRRRCVEERVRYFDLSGNVWLQEGPVIIKMEGAKNRFPHQAKERSPFADRASLVFRHLIGRKEPEGIRKIAGSVGLDPGYVSRVVHAAVKQGYCALNEKGKVRLRNVEEMLADWSAFYNWRRNDFQWFSWLSGDMKNLSVQLKRHMRRWPKEKYGLSLHAGNNLVEPLVSYNVWHLYAADDSIVSRVSGILGVMDSPPDAGNIVIMKPYYERSVFHGVRSIDGIQVVSDLQLYLDLRRFPVRGEEAAERILAGRLRPLWESARA